MGKPAARIGDMHTCPAYSGSPHIGGPILGPGCPTVLIGGMPAAVMTDMCVCIGPPDLIAKGSTGVFFGGKPAARMGDKCAHGGSITIGCPTVLIGDNSSGHPLAVLLEMVKVFPGLRQKIALKQAAKNGIPFCEKCHEAMFKASAANTFPQGTAISEEEYEQTQKEFAAAINRRNIFLNDPVIEAEKKKVITGRLASIYTYLSVEELTAIKVYTSNLKRNNELIYKTLNRELREGTLSDFNKGLNDLLSSGLSKLPLYQKNVFRGVSSNEADAANNWKVGEQVQFKDYKSTSTDTRVAAVNFSSKRGSGVIYEIVGANGSKVSDMSDFAGEQEVLLRSDSKFIVKEIIPDYAVLDKNYEVQCISKKIVLEYVG